MINKQLSITSSSGKKLFAQTWEPDSTPKANIILIHGFGEHSSRYEPYISLFIENGISVLSFDQIGHGKSEGKQGCIDSYEQLLEDVSLAIKKATELFPDTPNFIYGHSMGGNIAFNYLLKKHPKLNGAIITSPWLKLYDEPNIITRKAASILKTFLPNLTIDSKLDSKYISTIHKEVEKYNKDEFNHGRISLRLFDSINSNGMWASKNAHKLNVPTIMLHGSGDKITEHKVTSNTAKSNKELISYFEYKDMYHELHNDTVRKKIATLISNWIITKIN